ncbi:MAG: serine/threonine-protein kinase [Clostridiales bacterium]|nr:serine/threonine-protein kinase [Clostridiales bacterium]
MKNTDSVTLGDFLMTMEHFNRHDSVYAVYLPIARKIITELEQNIQARHQSGVSHNDFFFHNILMEASSEEAADFKLTVLDSAAATPVGTPRPDIKIPSLRRAGTAGLKKFDYYALAIMAYWIFTAPSQSITSLSAFNDDFILEPDWDTSMLPDEYEEIIRNNLNPDVSATLFFGGLRSDPDESPDRRHAWIECEDMAEWIDGAAPSADPDPAGPPFERDRPARPVSSDRPARPVRPAPPVRIEPPQAGRSDFPPMPVFLRRLGFPLTEYRVTAFWLAALLLTLLKPDIYGSDMSPPTSQAVICALEAAVILILLILPLLLARRTGYRFGLIVKRLRLNASILHVCWAVPAVWSGVPLACGWTPPGLAFAIVALQWWILFIGLFWLVYTALYWWWGKNTADPVPRNMAAVSAAAACLTGFLILLMV